MGHGGLLGIGEKHFLVPVEAVSRIDSDHVHIDRIRENLASAPGYTPTSRTTAYYGDVYSWWGYGPFWGPGSTYPAYPYYP